MKRTGSTFLRRYYGTTSLLYRQDDQTIPTVFDIDRDRKKFLSSSELWKYIYSLQLLMQFIHEGLIVK